MIFFCTAKFTIRQLKTYWIDNFDGLSHSKNSSLLPSLLAIISPYQFAII